MFLIFSKLPVNLKERLKAYLSPDEIIQLELDSETHSNELTKQSASNSILKLPVFQPTAAAAMMYQIQSTSQQKEKLKIMKKTSDLMSINNLYVNQNLAKKSPVLNSPIDGSASISLERPTSLNSGKISSGLIASILKKDSEDFSKKSYKLLPYICLQCKKDVVLCDSPTQTNPNDLDETNCLKIKFANQINPYASSSQFLRSKTIGSGLSKVTHHQKNASADLSNLKIATTSDDVFSYGTSTTKDVYKKQDKGRVDSWADLDSVSTII